MNSLNFLISAKAANVLYPLLFSLITVVELFLFVWLMVRLVGKSAASSSGNGEVRQVNYVALLPVILLVGFIVRLIFAFICKGYRPEINNFVSMFESLKSGFGKGYTNQTAPLTYYIYALFGSIANAFSWGAESVATPVLIKLPLIATDLVTAFLLYKLTKKYLNVVAAVVVAGFFCVCPLFIFSSGVWGSDYSLLTTFLVLTLYFVVEKNFIATIGCYSAAMLVHKDAMQLFPLVAVFVIYGLVKACITLRNSGGVTFKQMLKDTATRPVFTIPVSIIGFMLVSYCVSLPVIINTYGANFFKAFIFRVYLQPITAFTLFGTNSLGIFNIFMRNGAALVRFPKIVFTVLFGAIVTGIVLLVYLSKKNRANLVYLAGYILLTLATYFVGYSELSLIVAIAVFMTSFLLVRDKRIISVFALLMILVTVNATTVMSYAGYYNNLSEYYVGAEAVILKGGITAVNVTCSILAVLTHLYATVVLLDISMSNKRKILPYSENATFGKAISEYFRIKSK